MDIVAVVAANSAIITGSDTAVVLGYNVFRSQISGGPYTQINSVLLTGETLNYTDTTVQPGQVYYYVATAVNTIGASPFSNEIIATIPVPQTFVISTYPAGSSLAFGLTVGGTTPLSQTVTIIATPATALPVTVSSDQTWLTTATDSPTTKVAVTATVMPVGLQPGTYTANIVVTNTDNTATNSPFKVPVTLTITGIVPPPPVIA